MLVDLERSSVWSINMGGIFLGMIDKCFDVKVRIYWVWDNLVYIFNLLMGFVGRIEFFLDECYLL